MRPRGKWEMVRGALAGWLCGLVLLCALLPAEASEPDSTLSSPPQAETSKPDSTLSSLPQAETSKPDSTLSSLPQAEASEPDSTLSSPPQAETSKPDSTRTAAGESTVVGVEAPLDPFASFAPGEVAIFSINYGPINAGEGILYVLPMIDYDGSRCFHFRTRARSNRFFSAIFRVRDQGDSFMDSHSLVTRYFNKHLREGSYRRDVEIHFDQIEGKAYFPDGRQNDIPRGTQDVLSAFFRVRLMDLQVGMEFELPTHGDKSMYPLRVKVLRAEIIDTNPLGKVKCLVVQPFLSDDGLFKHEGDLLLWMTDDVRHIPVKMKANVPVGAIVVELKEYHAPDPLSAAEKEGVSRSESP